MTTDRRKVKLSKAKLRKIIIITAAVAAVLTCLAFWLRSRVTSRFGRSNDTEISTAEVTRGSISTSVYGSGRLSDDDIETQDIPSGVELTEILVSVGDKVAAGDVLASVNLDTVLAAMSDVNDEIADIDKSLSSAANTSAAGYISSSVSGRVKKLYAASGDSVSALMYKHGALALLSLDGYMAVDLDAAGLTAGETLSAVTGSGTELDATVADVSGSTATVLVSDALTAYGESVTVYAADGSTVGTGEAYIHDELKIIGYTGTVSYVSVAEGSAVGSGATLMTLTDTATGTEYASLLAERGELEDTLTKLITIYNEGALCAELDGTVIAVNAVTADEAESASYASAYASASAETAEEEAQSITLSPDKTMSMSLTVDETEILSVSIGQNASVTVDAIDGETFDGTVTGIDRAGTTSNGVTVYTAEVTIPKASGMLSGMSASATINIEGVENALLVPADAVNRSANGYYVYTSCDSESGTLGDMTEVTVGITNSKYAEILTGLDEGDTVYYIEKEDNAFSFAMPGDNFGGGGMPGGDNMPSGDFPGGGGGMPGGDMRGRG